MPAGREVPDWYQAKVESLLVPLEDALTPLLDDADGARRSAPRARCGRACTASPRSSTADKLAHVTAPCRARR